MKKILENKSIINMILSLTGGIGGYLISIVFINKFGIEEYGRYSLLLTYVILIGLILNLGLTDLILRDSYLEKNYKRKNIIEILVVTFFMYILFFIFSFPLKEKINNIFSEVDNFYTLFVLYVWYLMIKKILFSYLLSENKSHISNLIEQVIFKVLFLILIVICAVLKKKILIVLFLKIGIEISIILLLFLKNKLLNFKKIKFKYLMKKNLVYSWYLMLHQITEQGIFYIDKVLIGKYLLIQDVGGYTFSMALSSILMIIPSSIRAAKLPLFSKYMKEEKKRELEKLYKETQNIMVYLALPIVITLVFYSKEVLGIFNVELKDYNIVLIFLSLSSFSNIFFGFNGTIINMSSYFKFQFYIKIIFVVIIIISDIYLIKLYGIDGASIATFICFTIYNIIKTLLVWKKEKIHPFTINLINQIYSIILIFIISYYIKLNININLVVLILQGIFQYIILICFMNKQQKNKLKELFKKI